MYRPRQYSNVYGTGSTWRRHGPVPFQASIESSSNTNFDHTLLIERNVYEGLLPRPIGVVEAPLNEPEDQEIELTNFRCIGSYSWMGAPKDTPTILVPGSPPQWKNISLPIQVPHPDKGPRIIDQNGFRTSSGGIGYLLPVIAAVTHNQTLKEPPFDWSSVDVVTDRASLRKLIRWASNKLVFDQKIRKSDKLFRLDLQLAGKKTLLINRVSLKYAEENLYHTYREGLGNTAMTPAPGCRNALDYHRLVSYDMNGLKMVVRFEVDAYEPSASDTDDVEELAAVFEATSIESQKMKGLTIKKAGKDVPQASLLEMGTRWVGNKFPMDWSEIYCQLFLSQTPKRITAYHDNGVFDKIEERKLDSAPEFEAAKADVQEQMKKLVKVINCIRELVMKEGKNSRISLVGVYGALRVYKRKSRDSFLPGDVLQLFD